MLLMVLLIVVALAAAHHLIRGAVLSALRTHAREQYEMEGRRARRDGGAASGP